MEYTPIEPTKFWQADHWELKLGFGRSGYEGFVRADDRFEAIWNIILESCDQQLAPEGAPDHAGT